MGVSDDLAQASSYATPSELLTPEHMPRHQLTYRQIKTNEINVWLNQLVEVTLMGLMLIGLCVFSGYAAQM